MMSNQHLKLYIAVLDQVPDNMVPVLVAHSVLGAHIKFFGNDIEYDEWFVNSFRKCVLRVNQKEFNKMLELDSIYTGHENKTLNGEVSCIVISPRDEYPNVVKFSKLWAPNCNWVEKS